MGRGLIKTDMGDGLYSVELKSRRTRYEATIALFDQKIATYTDIWNGLEEGPVKEQYALRIAAIENEKKRLEKLFDADPTANIWCADYTEGMSGEVGTIEIPGERQAVNIQPGYEDNADYDEDRDGEVMPAVGSTPAGTFYNYAMMPGWQKFKPTYRYGTITAIDHENDKCDVDLDPAASSIKGINVNQAESLENVDIEYMECNAAAFNVGDEVIVKFTDQDWSKSKVIGFKDNPKPCTDEFCVISWDGYCIVINPISGGYFDGVKKNDDSPVTSWPVLETEISNWLGGFSDITAELWGSVNEYEDNYNDGGCLAAGSENDWDSDAETDCPAVSQNHCEIDDDDTGPLVGGGWYWGTWEYDTPPIPLGCDNPNLAGYDVRIHGRNWRVNAGVQGIDFKSWSGISATGLPSGRQCFLNSEEYVADGYESRCLIGALGGWEWTQKFSAINHIIENTRTINTPLGNVTEVLTRGRLRDETIIQYNDAPDEYQFPEGTYLYQSEPSIDLVKYSQQAAGSDYYYTRYHVIYSISGKEWIPSRAMKKSEKTAIQVIFILTRDSDDFIEARHVSKFAGGGHWYYVEDEDFNPIHEVTVLAAVDHIGTGIDGILNPLTMPRNSGLEQKITDMHTAVRAAKGYGANDWGAGSIEVKIYS